MGLNEKFFRSADEDEGFFNTVLYTGNGGTKEVTGVGFQPDLVWIKRRNGTGDPGMVDTLRGNNSALFTNSTSAESTLTGGNISMDVDGFDINTYGSTWANLSSGTYAAWCWKAGGAAVSNTDGDITSQVSANVANGFSIVKWSGDNSNMDIGHGLNSAPEIVIRKSLNLLNSWAFDTSAVDGSWDYLFLNTTAAKANHSSISLPTSTTFNTSGTSYNSSSMIAYCFHSVAGVSKVGSYTGNGTTGQLITTDFQPRFLLVKCSSGSLSYHDWYIFDNKRTPSNPSDAYLRANESTAEVQSPTYNPTFESTGFRWEPGDNSGGWNASGFTYIYYAIA